MITESTVLERMMKKSEIINKTNTFCKYVKERIKKECPAELQEGLLSYLQVFSIEIEISAESIYVFGEVNGDSKEKISRCFNLLTGDLNFDYEELTMFSELIILLNKGFDHSKGKKFRFYDSILLNRYSTQLTQLGSVIVEATRAGSTSTAGNLLADKLYKLSGNILHVGCFESETFDKSNEETIYKACADLYRSTEDVRIVDECEKLKEIIGEIRTKLDKGAKLC